MASTLPSIKCFILPCVVVDYFIEFETLTQIVQQEASVTECAWADKTQLQMKHKLHARDIQDGLHISKKRSIYLLFEVVGPILDQCVLLKR